MNNKFEVLEYKASDLVKGKMNEAFKLCTFGNPLRINHKQHGSFFMVNHDYIAEVVNGVMLSFCGLCFEVSESGCFYISKFDDNHTTPNEYTEIVKKIMSENYEGLPDMKDPFMFIATMISTVMFFDDGE